MQYYDVQKNWRKVKPILTSEHARRIIGHCISQFYEDNPRRGNGSIIFKKGYTPSMSESCDWRLSIKGRPPEYFKYVCHGLCHWLADLNLYCAKMVLPEMDWVILNSRDHSTVINGDRSLIFDMNFLALKISVEECWDLVKDGIEYDSLYLEESWGFIPNTDRLFLCSNMGRVKNLQDEILEPYTHRQGYKRLNVGSQADDLVHRMVATTWIPNPNDHPVVHHKDEVKDNNWEYNLQWTTYKGNSEASNCKGGWIKKDGNPIYIKNVTDWCKENGYSKHVVMTMISGKYRDLTPTSQDDKRPPN